MNATIYKSIATPMDGTKERDTYLLSLEDHEEMTLDELKDLRDFIDEYIEKEDC